MIAVREAQAYGVTYRRSDTTYYRTVFRACRATFFCASLYPTRSATNAYHLYRSVCTGAISLRTYRAGIRYYVTSDVCIDRRTSRVFPSGERLATYNLAISGGRGTQVL